MDRKVYMLALQLNYSTHIDVKETERQIVRQVLQLCSETVAKAFLFLIQRCGFGVNLEILESIVEAMENLRFTNNINKASKLPFQKGIQISCKTLLGLSNELKNHHLEYIMTARLNRTLISNSSPQFYLIEMFCYHY